MSFKMLNDDYENSFCPFHTGGVIYPTYSVPNFLINVVSMHQAQAKELILDSCDKVIKEIQRNLHNQSSSFFRR